MGEEEEEEEDVFRQVMFGTLPGELVDVNMKEPMEGETILHVACRYGHTHIVQRLLDEHPELDVNAVSLTLHIPISIAAALGHTDIVALLGPKSNKCTVSVMGLSVLWYGVRSESVDTVRTLVQGGFSTNIGAEPPIMKAVRMGAVDIVKCLLENDPGCEEFVDVITGRTPIIAAAYQSQMGILEMLLFHCKRVATVDMVDYNGNTALMYSVLNKCPRVVRLLREYHADPSVCNAGGVSPLAAAEGNESLRELLLPSASAEAS